MIFPYFSLNLPLRNMPCQHWCCNISRNLILKRLLQGKGFSNSGDKKRNFTIKSGRELAHISRTVILNRLYCQNCLQLLLSSKWSTSFALENGLNWFVWKIQHSPHYSHLVLNQWEWGIWPCDWSILHYSHKQQASRLFTTKSTIHPVEGSKNHWKMASKAELSRAGTMQVTAKVCMHPWVLS